MVKKFYMYDLLPVHRTMMTEKMGMKITFPGTTSAQSGLDLALCACFVFEGEVAENPMLQAVDPVVGPVLRQLIADEKFVGKKKQSVLLHTSGKLNTQRLLLIGAGKRRDFKLADVCYLTGVAARKANRLKVTRLGLVLDVGQKSEAKRIGELLAVGASLAGYQFDRYLPAERRCVPSLEELMVHKRRCTRGRYGAWRWPKAWRCRATW
jgi:leucyl aminopeptidase